MPQPIKPILAQGCLLKLGLCVGTNVRGAFAPLNSFPPDTLASMGLKTGYVWQEKLPPWSEFTTRPAILIHEVNLLTDGLGRLEKPSNNCPGLEKGGKRWNNRSAVQ
jgi:hypothetical protein